MVLINTGALQLITRTVILVLQITVENDVVFERASSDIASR